MTTEDKPDIITLYSTNKSVEVKEIDMRLKISKGRVSCHNLALAPKFGRSLTNQVIREIDVTGHAPKQSVQYLDLKQDA
eukprot:9677090-Ditylum_brightwellii.AAC.1